MLLIHTLIIGLIANLKTCLQVVLESNIVWSMYKLYSQPAKVAIHVVMTPSNRFMHIQVVNQSIIKCIVVESRFVAVIHLQVMCRELALMSCFKLFFMTRNHIFTMP